MKKVSLVFCLGVMVLLVTKCQKEGVVFNGKNYPYPTSLASAKANLGNFIFFDKNLSNPAGQSCETCHGTTAAFTDSLHTATSAGAVKGLFGLRNAPTAMYTSYVPALHYSPPDSGYKGGLFLDGRVNTLEEQAQKPFFNPIEMNLTDPSMLAARIRTAAYYPLYRDIYGPGTDPSKVLTNVADAIASFERTNTFHPFTSKFDYYLKGQAILSSDEMAGLNLFNDTLRAKCSTCHLTDPDSASGKIMFTDFTYNSDGVPANPNNPYYHIPIIFNPMGAAFVDSGLVATTHDPESIGNFRVATLRNIALTAPYFHNGVFQTLEQVVHFYNTRDLGAFQPEIPLNVDSADMGNLGLSAKEEKQIVAFLKTLTDGYKK